MVQPEPSDRAETSWSSEEILDPHSFCPQGKQGSESVLISSSWVKLKAIIGFSLPHRSCFITLWGEMLLLLNRLWGMGAISPPRWIVLRGWLFIRHRKNIRWRKMSQIIFIIDYCAEKLCMKLPSWKMMFLFISSRSDSAKHQGEENKACCRRSASLFDLKLLLEQTRCLELCQKRPLCQTQRCWWTLVTYCTCIYFCSSPGIWTVRAPSVGWRGWRGWGGQDVQRRHRSPTEVVSSFSLLGENVVVSFSLFL